jgi:hypothetical protein
MNRQFFSQFLSATIALLMMTGCSDHDRQVGHAHEETGTEHQPVTGFSFKESSGLFLTDKTIHTLGVQTMEPPEKILVPRLEAMARVYAPGRATALLDATHAFALVAGGPVDLGPPLHTTGTLAQLDRQMEKSLGQIEALIEFVAPTSPLSIGEAIPVAFTTGSAQSQLVVPASSLLQTGEGSFVFVVNGGHFLRTRVRLGTRHGDWTAVTDGLLAGDVIVTNGVSGLWCLELQATKAGAGCAH